MASEAGGERKRLKENSTQSEGGPLIDITEFSEVVDSLKQKMDSMMTKDDMKEMMGDMIGVIYKQVKDAFQSDLKDIVDKTNENYFDLLKATIKNSQEYHVDCDPQILWDLVKMDIRGETIKYATNKKKQDLKNLKELEQKLENLSNTNPPSSRIDEQISKTFII
ncbi:hypothetical protein LOTGIDRAFT_163225 [Lottia gigantea]|uniref:Uncharacterized protein n=1 Tax=Lottia gigantea TaxID=225164 RepID=V4BSG3_LOTGI|nr:hypothetical protein LOTGIDRAFT_163225 [Lottia gigantea]ESO91864.1 hypothetical protein LOTGIDRAFT_163225 [Lottia gigantea]